MLFLKSCYVNTTDEVDALSISHDLKYAIRDSGSPDGLLTVLVPEAGAGLAVLTPIEEAVEELKASIEVFASEAGTAKDKLKRDREIAPIVQSAILGRTIHLPFKDGELLIDPYDEVLLFDLEKKAGRREFIVQVMSEAPAPEGGGQAPQQRKRAG